MKTRIHVTEKDIRLGCKGNFINCPIARAMSRKTRVNIVVCQWSFAGKISNNLPEIGHTRFNNPKVSKFVKDFDAFLPVKRFSFTVNIPDELL